MPIVVGSIFPIFIFISSLAKRTRFHQSRFLRLRRFGIRRHPPSSLITKIFHVINMFRIFSFKSYPSKPYSIPQHCVAFMMMMDTFGGGDGGVWCAHNLFKNLCVCALCLRLGPYRMCTHFNRSREKRKPGEKENHTNMYIDMKIKYIFYMFVITYIFEYMPLKKNILNLSIKKYEEKASSPARLLQPLDFFFAFWSSWDILPLLLSFMFLYFSSFYVTSIRYIFCILYK